MTSSWIASHASHNPARRALTRRGFGALAAGTLLSGCGVANLGSNDSAAAAGPGFPVTVKHAFGSTTVESTPQRVVTVGLRDQDTLLALGIKARGAMDWFQGDTFAKWPWEKWGGTSPKIVSDGGFDINFERVALQRPDLILAVYSGLERGEYDKLAQIAPTVAHDPAYQPYSMPWRAEARMIARSVGREQQANRLIKEVEERFAQVRQAHPEFDGRTAVIADPGGPGVSAFTSTDSRGQFLKEMGFTNPENVDKDSTNGFNAEYSDEELEQLDVDYLFFLIDAKNRQQEIYDNPLLQRLPAYRNGRVVELPYYDKPQYGAAIAFNTVLSIPYGIDGMLEQIELAAKRPR